MATFFPAKFASCSDFKEIWFMWGKWYSDLNGANEIFFRVLIFKMASTFSAKFTSCFNFNEIWFTW